MEKNLNIWNFSNIFNIKEIIFKNKNNLIKYINENYLINNNNSNNNNNNINNNEIISVELLKNIFINNNIEINNQEIITFARYVTEKIYKNYKNDIFISDIIQILQQD